MSKSNGSMNRVYRVVWNAAKAVWQAVAEVARGQGKTQSVRIAAVLSAGAFVLISLPALAADILPTGGTVVGGSLAQPISTSNGAMTIRQSSDKLALDWQSFNIGRSNSVQFIQPSSSSIALNRVLGSDVSIIQGALKANGQVFLLNPNGVLFTSTAQIDVGGLVASTLNLSNENFMAGNYRFEGNSSNAIINQGNIKVGAGGTAAFIAAKITNTGTIEAPKGNVLMGAGSKVTLDLGGPVKLQVEQGAIDALIESGGAIKAEAGTVLLSAKAAGDLAATVINHTGLIEAQTLATGENGQITLLGEGAEVKVSGTLDASAPNGGTGGKIVATGKYVLIDEGARLNADGAHGGGSVLVGGSWQNSDPGVYQATATAVAPGAKLTANATDNGDGGTVVAWSDIHNPDSVTRAYGNFEARGGANGGDGGRIETSGHMLDVNSIGDVITLAPKGKNGVWLLDPTNVTIADGSNTSGTTWSSGTPYTLTAPTTGDIYLTPASIQSKLASGNVTVSAADTVMTVSNIVWSNANILTLQAGRDIDLRANITTTIGSNAQLNLMWGTNTAYVDSAKLKGTSTVQLLIDKQIYMHNVKGYGSSTVNYKMVTKDIKFGYPATNGVNSYATFFTDGGDVTANINVLSTGTPVYISGTNVLANATFSGTGTITNTSAGGQIKSISGYSLSLDTGTAGKAVHITGTMDSFGGTFKGAGNVQILSTGTYTQDLDNGGAWSNWTGSLYVNGTANLGGMVNRPVILQGGTLNTVNTSSYAPTFYSVGIGGGGSPGYFNVKHDTTVKELSGGAEGGTVKIDSAKTLYVQPAASSNKVLYAKLDGAGALVLTPQSGTAELAFNGDAGAGFSGAVTLNSGFIAKAGHNNAFGAPAGVAALIVNDGATLKIGSGVTMNSSRPLHLYGAGAAGMGAALYVESGTGTVGGPTSLKSNTTIGTKDANAHLTLGSTVDGLFALSVYSQGNVTFNGSVGVSNALTSITTDAGGKTIFGGAAATQIKTSGRQTYNDNVENTLASTYLRTFTTTYTGTTVASGGLKFGGSLTSTNNGGITLSGGGVGIDAQAINTGTGDLYLSAYNATTGDIKVAGTITAGKLYVGNTNTLTQLGTSSNNVSTLAANTMGAGANLTWVDADGLAIDTIGSNSGISISGKVNISTRTGDINIKQYLQTTSTAADAMILNAGSDKAAGDASGGNILWNSTQKPSVGSGGKAIFYTGSVSGSATLVGATGKPFATGSGKFRYNSDESSAGYNTSTAALGTGLYLIYREQPTLSATADTTTTYNGSAVTSGTLNWVTQNGDTIAQLGVNVGGLTTNWGGTLIGAKNAGTSYTVNATVTGSLANGLGYLSPASIVTGDGVGTINKKALNLVATKTYDGTTSLDGFITLGGLVGTETLNYTATASNQNVVTANKYVSAITLSDGTNGGLAANYSLPGLTTYNATTNKVTINAKEVALSAVHTYNASTTLAAGEITISTGVTANGLTEHLNFSGTALAKDANVIYNLGDSNNYIASGITLTNGTAKTGYSAGTATNYTLPSLAARSANNSVTITPKELTVTATKTYDGTTALSTVSLGGYIGSQTLTYSGATASSKDVAATNKYVSGITLGNNVTTGGVATNYKILSTYDATKNKVTINTRALTSLTGTREYDGTTTVNGSAFTAVGLIAGDSLIVTGSVTTSSANASTTAYTQSASTLTLSNSNYSKPANASVTITKRTLTLSDLNVADRTYTGATTASTISSYGNLSGKVVISNVTDDVSVNGGTVAAFSGADAGTYSVGVTSLTLTGTKASNYQLASTSFTDYDVKITPKSISFANAVNFTDRAYNGTTALTIASNPTYAIGTAANQVLDGDKLNVIISGGSGALPSKNAGTYSITATGFSLTGTKAGNYVLASSESIDTSVIISKANLAVTGAAGAVKTYDGTTAVTTDTPYTYSGIFAGDSLSFTGATAYNSKDAGTSKTITQGSLALAGNDANNYQIAWSNGSGTINKATLTMKANDAIKVVTEDNPTFSASYEGFVAGEGVLALTSPTVSTTAVKMSASGAYTLTPSATAANYEIVPINGTLTIAPVGALVVQLDNKARVYGAGNPSFTAQTTAKYASGTPTVVDGIVTDASGLTITTFTLTANGSGGYTGNDGTLDGQGNPTSTISFTPTTLAKTTSDVGNYAITAQITAGGVKNYTTALVSNGTLSITPLQATLAASAVTKVYDGTTKVLSPGAAVSNKVGSDDVVVSGLGFYTTNDTAVASKDVATATKYTMSNLVLSGAKAGNYFIANADLSSGISGTGSITAKEITVSATASDKVYNRDVAATVALSSSGVIAGDTVTFSGTGEFDNWNVGTNKTVMVSGITHGGAQSTNYSLSSHSATTSASITPKAITFDGVASDKVYTATTDASVTNVLSGFIAEDADYLSVTHTAARFADKNVGQNKTVAISGIALSAGTSGNASGNYSIADTATKLANITPASLTITAATDTKVYDGTTLSSAAPTVSGLLGSDSASNLSQVFVSDDIAGVNGKDAKGVNGSTLAVKAGYLLADGNNGGNYTVSLVNTNGTITQKSLTMTANNAARVINDTDPTLTARYIGFIAGENEGVLSGVSITRAAGTSAGTYTITPSANATNYAITPVTGTFTIEGADKLLVQLGDMSAVYGSTPDYVIGSAKYYSSSKTQLMTLNVVKNADGSYSANDGLGGGLDFTLASSGTNVGNQTVDKATATQIGNNFTAYAFDSANLAITPKLLQLTTGGSVTKEYDGGLTATGANITSSSVVGTDNISITGNALFSDKNVGAGKTVSISGITVGGTALANYYVDATTLQNGITTSGEITAKNLTVLDTVVANKVYDGTAVGSFTSYGSLVGVVTGDTVSINGLGGTATFDSPNAGNSRSVTIANLALAGVNAGNYTISQPTGVTADITKKLLTVTATNATKTYDGITYSGGNGVSYSGFVGSESATNITTTGLTYTGTSQTAKNVGTYVITAGGLAATNYEFSYVSGQLSITPKTINVTGATVGTKTYDGTVSATVSGYGTLNDFVSGDAVSINQGGIYAQFNDKNAGTGKAASIYGYALSGAAASNYVLDSSTETATADIAKKALTITANDDARFVTQMDNSAYSGVRYSGFVNGETESVLSGGAFVSRDNAATNISSGTYSSVLTPFGYTSNNYDISYVKGSYTIAAAGKMIVKVDNTSTAYGTSASYGIGSVEYEAGGAVKSLTYQSHTGNAYTYSDGAGTVTFTITPTTTVGDTSGSGSIKAGSYSLSGTNFSESTANFNGTNADVTYTGMLTINPAAYSITVSGTPSKEYDGTRTLNTNALTINASGLVSGDSVTRTASGAYAAKNAGTGLSYTVNYVLSGGDAVNYYFADGGVVYGTNGVITRKALTVAGVSVADREYDGTTLASFANTGTGLNGAIAGDNVAINTANIAASFADKNVAYSGSDVIAKNVSVTGYAINGTDAANYTLTAPSGLMAKITPKTLAVTGLTVDGKVYDGNVSASIIDAGTINKITGDNVNFSTVAIFTNKNVETTKLLNLDFTLSGTDATNYALVDRTNVATSALISQRALTVSGITVASREYNGNATATLSNAGTINKIGADDVGLSTVTTFNNKNVEDAKTVSYDYTLSGGDAGNYILADVSNVATSALITRKALTVSDLLVADKTYDGLVNATLSNAGAINKVSGDDVSYTVAATFNNKDVETTKTVNLVYSLGGSEANNYTLTNQSGLATTAKINKLTLNNQFLASDKTYDGNDSASVAATILNKVGTDDLTLSYGTTLFSDKNAGVGKTVTISGLQIAGNDLGNYQLAGATATTTATITKKTITSITGITASDKTYDANNFATLINSGAVIADKVSGDTLTIANAVGTFTNKDVAVDGSNNAIAKTVNIGNFVLAGADAGNYDVTGYATTASAKINKAALTMTANNEAVVYSDTMPTFTAYYSGFVGGETASVLSGVGFTGAPANTLASGSYTITPTATSTNYSISPVAGTFRVIPADTLLVKIADKNITYGDAQTDFGISSAKFYKNGTGLVSLTATNTGNDFTLTDGANTAATFSLTANGVNAGNYVISSTNFVKPVGYNNYIGNEFDTGILSIAQKSLTVTASGASKTYDGTVIASGAQLGVTGKVGADDVVAVGATGVFAAKNAGQNLAYTIYGVSLSGAAKDNYFIDTSGGTTFTAYDGVINKKSLTINGVAVADKEYNGNDLATITNASKSLVGVVNGETVALDETGASARFSNKNVAYDGSGAVTSKSVSVLGYLLSGTTGVLDNYTLAQPTDITAQITPIALSLTNIAAASRDYNGSDVASVTADLSGVLTADSSAVAKSIAATFADKNVGTTKTVTLNTVTLSGAESGNYSISNGQTTTANINRLASVTWIGGNTGNWFDPANWAGGAVPDLSNVANVVIPTGVVVSFNSTVTAPAQAGTVNVDSIGTLGGLDVSAGTLAVANNLQLANYVQSGGSVSTGGNFTITNSFDQSGGSVTATGNVAITQTTGNTTLGNLSAGGTLVVNAIAGSIQQAINSTIAATGATTLNASGDITLESSTNDFGSVTATGVNIALTDANDMTVELTASGNSTLSAGGNLGVSGTTNDLTTTTTNSGTTSFGTTTVAGNLSTTSAGAVSQTSALAVTGTAAFSAAGQNVTLDNAGNDFGGTVTATANDLALKDSNGITLGNITTSGTLGVTAGGNISQSSGSTIAATGATTLTASGNITLDSATNDFGSVTATGGNIALSDANGMTVDLTASGNSTLTAGGNLAVSGTTNDLTTTTTNGGTTTFGATTVAGDLSATSAGNISQTGPLTITGSTTLAAAGQDVTLDNPSNSFTGVINANANNIDLVASASLQLGDITASGYLDVLSTQGNVTQVGAISVTGERTVSAPSGTVTGADIVPPVTVALEASIASVQATAASGSQGATTSGNTFTIEVPPTDVGTSGATFVGGMQVVEVSSEQFGAGQARQGTAGESGGETMPTILSLLADNGAPGRSLFVIDGGIRLPDFAREERARR